MATDLLCVDVFDILVQNSQIRKGKSKIKILYVKSKFWAPKKELFWRDIILYNFFKSQNTG